MKGIFRLIIPGIILSVFNSPVTAAGASGRNTDICPDGIQGQHIRVEYLPAGSSYGAAREIPLVTNRENGAVTVSQFRNEIWQVEIHEICRGTFTEVTGELSSLDDKPACATLRIIFPLKGKEWKWFRGLDGSAALGQSELAFDTVAVHTVVPPDGAFNGSTLSEGGYGDPVGRGTMSYYPLCAVDIDGKGEGLGTDISLPAIYRLGAGPSAGLVAEFDFAASPRTAKFPGRAFFRLCRFNFDPEWGMRAALSAYYSIYPDAFRKRVINEGIWLPFTPLRSIPGWEEYGIAFHETSWGSRDKGSEENLPTILSDRGTGVLCFQYTEPWDLQLPVRSREMDYTEMVSGGLITREHRTYLDVSSTHDKNGRWQARRLETPWFSTGWAVSITTNCDPDLPDFNKYRYVLRDEISPALQMDVDGIYFDSMEWNWHHDLNYREDHFEYTDYPLTFSASVGRPAIWNFASEFKFMKKISDEMHLQGKLAMGNGHGWNPFAAANLDLFGAELSWYSSDDHNVKALDFKRAIACQKPIVFLLNEGLNDTAFTEPPYSGYEIYFEKMLAYGFFPSFFSVDASNDPYWQDREKTKAGRPFFKKYIPVIKEIAGAGWEPVTYASSGTEGIRIERFGTGKKVYLTVRNNGNRYASCQISLDTKALGLTGGFEAVELVENMPVKHRGNTISIDIPAGRTKVLRIDTN